MSILSKTVRSGAKAFTDINIKAPAHFLNSALGNVTGARDRKKAQATADTAIAEAKTERDEQHAAEDKANAQKTVEKNRLNKKQTRAARNSLRRPGFLDSSVEGTSDVLG